MDARTDREGATPTPLSTSPPSAAEGPRTTKARPVRRWRVLLAHDGGAATCDGLAIAVAAALGDADIVDASSVDDARLAVSTEAFDVCLVCLDLPPAPIGGARLASELVTAGHPVVLVTRSLRWIPHEKQALRELPWIAPEASEDDVTKAIAAAGADLDSMIRPRAQAVLELLEAVPSEARVGRVRG